MRTVLSKWELGACASLVVYFLYILYSEGVRFSNRLVTAGLTVPGLQPWLVSGQVDVSDYQWREFRASTPILAAAMGGFVICSRAVQATAPQHRVLFYLVFALVLLAVLHGACLLYVLALSLAGYYLAKATAQQPYGLVIVWAWHCSTFLLIRAFEGFPFKLLGPGFAALDQHRGMLRWHIHYNLLLLRMLSFAADYRWQLQRKPGRVKLPPDTPPSPKQDLRIRTELWQDPSAYNSLLIYLAYLLYPPLYIAGPISTFNAFASQMAAPAASITPKSVGLYLLRAAGCWACIEWLTHK
jgi:D-alanyl-lipoteichoic acid acyltransferase DltB (MBOAT superfamily)